MKMKQVRWLVGCHLLFMGLLHIPHLPVDIQSEPASYRAFQSKPIQFSSDGHHALHEVASPRHELLDTTTCSLFLLGTSIHVLRPKPAKPAAGSVLHTRPPPLNMCHHRPRPASPPSLCKLRLTRTSAILTWSIWSLPCNVILIHICKQV